MTLPPFKAPNDNVIDFHRLQNAFMQISRCGEPVCQQTRKKIYNLEGAGRFSWEADAYHNATMRLEARGLEVVVSTSRGSPSEPELLRGDATRLASVFRRIDQVARRVDETRVTAPLPALAFG